MLRIIVIALFSLVVLIGLSAATIDTLYGGGELFPERQVMDGGGHELEVVANLPYPAGNIAVTADGKVFFTFHPEARPSYNLAELVDGQAQPLRIDLPEGISTSSVLSLRVDQQDRLWLLDYGVHGSEPVQLLAIDVHSRKLVHHHVFSSDIAPLGSHFNDFQVDAAGQTIYIADASILGLDPALVVYDVASKTARRLLEDHASVKPDNYVPVVQHGPAGRPEQMLALGIFAVRPGVDSIALSRDGQWLYFAPITDTHIHRVRISDLTNVSLPESELAQRIEAFAETTMSDGITMDDQGRLYLSDIEHSAIVRLPTQGSDQGQLQMVYQGKDLRWPDGFSFGPAGELYIAASALQFVIAKPDGFIKANGPYQIFKLATDASATAGH